MIAEGGVGDVGVRECDAMRYDARGRAGDMILWVMIVARGRRGVIPLFDLGC